MFESKSFATPDSFTTHLEGVESIKSCLMFLETNFTPEELCLKMVSCFFLLKNGEPMSEVGYTGRGALSKIALVLSPTNTWRWRTDFFFSFFLCV